ncbi:MAG: EAL domain-containing protein [Thiothrix sp.]|uniref:EAL domain-containing protein n=1 Tax=Thiothrix sp. TaxID=1032 RepID=UPI0026055D17|nr:EAL domain-containing protein [Thiothrix sp.]MDD5394565.1 EAL domain-containing protein [Thiothrix sp.]
MVVDRDAEMVATLEAALRSSGALLELVRVASMQQLTPVLVEHKPHLLFCPHIRTERSAALLESLQRYSPDTLLVWVSPEAWQGLATGSAGVESCILPLNDVEYFGQYVDFLLHYSLLKHEFRQSKHLLGIAELRCHWLVDYSWEAIAYVSQGAHLYANNAYLTLFGFGSVAELRIIPVAQLVDAEERKVFEALGKATDVGSKPSNRLLTTLLLWDGGKMRAEIRFIPAVLKGKRCYQLHVHPLEKQARATPIPRVKENPWDKASQSFENIPAPTAQPQSSPTPPTREPPLAQIQAVFLPSIKLREKLPLMYFAEPEFHASGGEQLGYDSLVLQLRNEVARFRLDYWNLGQTLLRLSSRKADAPGHLIFVSVGKGIFDNGDWCKRLLGLLVAAPEVARQIVIGVQYQDCVADIRHFSRVAKWLRAAKVHLGIDNVVEDARLLAFIRVVKPAFVRLVPALAANAGVNTEDARRLHKLVHQLSETGSKVIVSGVNEAAALSLVCATSASYIQGSIVRHQ